MTTLLNPITYTDPSTGREVTVTTSTERQQAALDLRTAGYQWNGIARRLGFANPGAARNAAMRALTRQALTMSGGTVAWDSLTFGAEFEFTGISRERMAAVITAAGIACYAENYNHQTRSHWKVVTDASVYGGGELVSPILRGQAGLDQVERVLTAARAAGATVNASCGFHVHIGVGPLTGDQIGQTVRTYAALQDEIDWLVAPSRRHSGWAAKLTGSEVAHLQAGLARFANGEAAKQARYTGLGNRYKVVNTVAIATHGTIEFRQHQGTMSGRKATAWIQMLLTMTAAAASGEVLTGADFPTSLTAHGLTADRAAFLTGRAIGFGR